MANHSISMQGIGAQCMSAKKGASGTAGYPCKISANDTVINAASGDAFCGVITGLRGTLATVQYAGFVTLPYSSTAPSVGYAILVADGSGGVKTAQSGKSYLVTNVNTTAGTVTVLL